MHVSYVQCRMRRILCQTRTKLNWPRANRSSSMIDGSGSVIQSPKRAQRQEDRSSQINVITTCCEYFYVCICFNRFVYSRIFNANKPKILFQHFRFVNELNIDSFTELKNVLENNQFNGPRTLVCSSQLFSSFSCLDHSRVMHVLPYDVERRRLKKRLQSALKRSPYKSLPLFIQSSMPHIINIGYQM